MAKATIVHAFADGATVTASVESSNDYPDSAVDCVLRVVDLYRQPGSTPRGKNPALRQQPGEFKPKRTGCLIEGCNERHNSRGYCRTHAHRDRTHGDPLTVLSTAGPRGELNPGWQNDAVGYSAAHARLKTLRGRAAQFRCVHCDGEAAEWAFIHGSPGEQWDEKARRRFSPDVADYQPMCRPCHRRYDATAERLVDKWLASA